MLPPTQNIIVLGGGSAGFIAALTLKRRLPQLRVRVVRSPDIGVIGVGEGTTQLFPRFFFEYLKLKPEKLYAEAEPTWKLGIRFLWGPRPHFHYTFSPMIDQRWPELPKQHGFYCEESFENLDLWSALMGQDKALPRAKDHTPAFFQHNHLGLHIENDKLVRYLEARCRDFAVEIIDATVKTVETGETGVRSLILESGEELTADLFVDASGFRAELLGRTFHEPFLSYDRTLFCDRAVIGGWPRTNEPIKPYTLAETMDAGWSWQIEHEHWINRGYVYSSRFISDEAALDELTRKNPQIANQPRQVKFRTGRYERMWIGNTVGIGNASGFVEPLEASALQVIIIQCRTLADMLIDTRCEVPPSSVKLYNQFVGQVWDDVRDFLAVHYRFNTRLETPFWQTARAEVDLAGAAPLVEFYRENGPRDLGKTILLGPNNPYGLEGYYAMLVGQKVPHQKSFVASDQERRVFERYRKDFLLAARAGFDVRQTLEFIRRPAWKWS
jgi:tryptophan halogenase